MYIVYVFYFSLQEILPFRNLPCNLSETEVQQCVSAFNLCLQYSSLDSANHL